MKYQEKLEQIIDSSKFISDISLDRKVCSDLDTIALKSFQYSPRC